MSPNRPFAATTRQLEQSYDDAPYGGKAFHQTHPVRLATVAAASGVYSAPVDSCRVLELGCSVGANLLPMAEAYPGSSFVGVDLSSAHVRTAQRSIDELSLANARVLQHDIFDIGEDFGTFDYIICHGVFSWVPPDVQGKILEICRVNANPNGVSFINYNAFPGWHVKGHLRQIMLGHVAGVDRSDDRIVIARRTLQEIISSIDATTSFGAFLQPVVEQALNSPDHMIAHDFLEVINDPMYLKDFVAATKSHGLTHLHLGGPRESVPHLLHGQRHQDTEQMVESEQTLDIIRNTTFRGAVLCRSDCPAASEGQADMLPDFHVMADLAPVAPSVLLDESEVNFSGHGGKTTTSAPLLKIALHRLGQLGPASISLHDLAVFVSGEILNSAVTIDDRSIESLLIDVFADLQRPGIVEVLRFPYNFTTTISETPKASAWAQMQIRTGEEKVTNRRHMNLKLTSLNRFLLAHLDGSRTQSELVELAHVAAIKGTILVLAASGTPMTDPDQQLQRLQWLVPQSLDLLAYSALLTS